MFVITKADSYLWPIKIEHPVDGGKWDTQTFDARFKRLTQSRLLEVKGKVNEMPDADFAKEILVGWEGINDESGQPVPFSETMRDRLFDVPGFVGVIVRFFFESLDPSTGAKRKN